MLIEKNTSHVIYTHMLPTEDECVDKYIKKLPPIVDKYNAFLDIDISENTYLRHLITAEWASKLQKKTSTDYSTVILESFLKASNEYSLEGGPGETALTTAISLDDFETAAYISRKYVDTVTTSVILQTIINDNMRLLEEFKSIGIDITKVGEKGVWCACINKNIEILRLLIKNGTKVQATSGDMLGVICNESYCSREIIFELVTNSTNSSNNAAKLHGCAETGKTLKFDKIIKAFLGRLNIHGRKAMMIMSQLTLGNIWYMQENIKGMYVVSREAIWCYAMEWTVKQLLFNIVDHIEKNKLHHTILEAKITGPISVFKKTIAGETVLSDCDYELAKSNIVDRNLGMIGLLIDGGLDANLSNHLVLRTAYKSGDIGWIDYFIEKGAKLGTEGYCGLDEACQSDNIEVLKHWFRNGGTVPTDPKHNGVRVASSVGNFEMVRLLVKNGACLSDPTYSGIKEACELNHQEILKYLVKNNAAVGDLEYYQWENAVMTGDVKLANMILEYYANMRMSKKGKERALEEKCTLTLPKTQTPESDPEYEYLKVVLEHSSIIDEYDLVEDLWMAKALRRNKTATLLSKWNMESFACRIEEFKSKKDYFI
ncbi:putative ankyrin repeat protein L25 [Zancudomyces culisetae]|uniref:Putative ankyrin repeat protein L25 n=1 Tax=Zancudomyces culisetae TaxID=1213189 RepID=A0A1R1PF44_ZANCU|nr:putative ankyrin repeat protein L25 [Zancudomyces culisetae]|eukprot:OMH79625.1 putative ankyrin repeat protein L25 [Zancudomyces culisetae]